MASDLGCSFRSWLAVLLIAGVRVPQLAAAQTSPTEREIARSAMQSGDQLHESGDLPGALQRYRSAHAIMHVPTTGIAVARTEAELSLLVEARSTAMEVINLPGAEQESVVFANARAAAVELAATLEPRVPSIVVEVSPGQLSYAITLDGKALPAGLILKANPGPHVIEVSAPGFQRQSHTLALTEAETSRLRIQLDPVPAPTAVSASTPPTLVPISSVPPPTPLEQASPNASALGASKTRALVSLSVGGVLLLGGAAAGVTSIVQTARIEPQCDEGYCGPHNRSRLSTANTLANIANIALPLGLVGVGYAIYEFLSLDRPAPSPDRASAQGYWLGPSSVGVRW